VDRRSEEKGETLRPSAKAGEKKTARAKTVKQRYILRKVIRFAGARDIFINMLSDILQPGEL
jgi:hypothetical protein